ncbi:hypothetical protein Dsin_012337 [Dipteronia sinensis]|uniref:Uncharacterized protein n=1 Tax=Dipteronia sinensis TaxID=43782 RepID=A0AAE0AJ64_9ROSI|nr:hypothetical protein Dsin_012337 [Dipteronia sinensis]
MPIVYELMRVMKDAVKQQRGAYYLNPKYQYRDNIRDNSDLLKAVHNVYAQLDTEATGIANFGNEEVGMLVQQVGMFMPEVGILVQHVGMLVRQVGMLIQVILIKIVVDNMEQQVKLMMIL